MKNYTEFCDEELVQMYRAGDNFALNSLLERYKHMVRKKARQLFISGGETEDLIQEGMIGVFNAISSYEEGKDASFYTFAMLCMNSQLKNAITASNRKKNQPLNNYVSFDEPAGSNGKSEDKEGALPLSETLSGERDTNPEAVFIDQESTDDLQKRAYESLSKFEKKVFEMYLDGEDYTTIAEVLGKSPKSIDNALQRIKNKVDKIAQLI